MFCKKYFASYQGHVFSFSYAKHVLKMGISSWGQLSNAAISEEKSLRFIAHNFLSLWGINKCVLKKSFFYLDRVLLCLSTCSELNHSHLWRDAVGRCLTSSQNQAEEPGLSLKEQVSERAVCFSVASRLPQSWETPGKQLLAFFLRVLFFNALDGSM